MKEKDSLYKNNGKLRSFSQVMSLERLADKDVQVEGGVAGGDKGHLTKDIQDE